VPRGDPNVEDVPYHVWIGKVEKQNRIRLNKDIQDVVSWLKTGPGPIDCIGTPGPAGGLQVEPFASHATQRSGFIATLGKTRPTSLESGERWIEAARLLASSWHITVNVESSRVSMNLPEPTRRLLRLPEVGSMIAVFGFGEILEIWDALMWHEHVRKLAKARVSLLSDAIEEMEHR
jgi:hypothetical protein